MDFKLLKHRNNLMEIFPLLLCEDSKKGQLEITPSCFIKEMTCSTNERMEKLVKVSKLKKGKIFKVIPSTIIFQNFIPGAVNTVTVILVNVTEVPKPLRIEMEPSAYFSVRHSSENIWTKVAPGMSFSLEVKFIADDFADYKHSIVFLTEGDSINLNLIGIGPRPLLDIPDSITLPTTAINIQTERTIILRNLSEVPACFTLITNPPFSTKPDRGIIKPNKCMQLTIFCKPKHLGEIIESVTLLYDSGERLNISLKTISEEAEIVLSKDVLKFENTFMGLSEKTPIELKNLSSYKLSYCWKKHKNLEEETKLKMSLLDKFKEVKDYELKRDSKIKYYNVANNETNQEIYDRIFDDEEDNMETEDYQLFNSPNFIIEPKFGDLWSGAIVNFEVIFRPKIVGQFEEVVYLQINGQSTRKKVTLKGCSEGPKVVLNVELIDAQNIFIRAVHKYEIVITNIGLIPATIKYLRSPTKFGGKFRCKDSYLSMKPKTATSIYIEYFSEVRGKFFEQVSFMILESKEILKLFMIGNIVCPLLSFTVNELDFGDISLGIPVTLEINLNNSSQVPVEFAVLVPEDGLNKSFTLSEFSISSGREHRSQHPKEFTIRPYFGEVEPYNKLPIRVTLVPNTLGYKEASLNLFMWGSKHNNRSIPLKYNSHIPEVICLTPKIELKSMFITQPYIHTLEIKNITIYRGWFIINTTVFDEACIEIITDINETMIEPHDSVDIKVTLKSDCLGPFAGEISLDIFGKKTPLVVCEISGDTRGPCIDIFIDKLNIGEVPTLQIIEKQVRIVNDSPISANLTIETYGDCFLPIDRNMIVPPEQIKILNLQFYGTISGKFKNSITIDVENGDCETFTFTGTFFGGCILFEPSLDHNFYTGILLTENSYKFCFNVKNKGPVNYSLFLGQTKTVTRLKDFLEPPESVFKIVPNQFELEPDEVVTIEIQGFSKISNNVAETFHLHAKSAHSVKIVHFKSFIIYSEFRDPVIATSKNALIFRIDVATEGTTAVVEDDIVLLNKTGTAVEISIDIDEPFYLQSDNILSNHESFELISMEKHTIGVKFQPNIIANKCIEVQGFLYLRYRNHPKIDKIRIIGNVNFPAINFLPHKIDFPGVPLNQKINVLLKMINTSPLSARFKFHWNGENFYLETGFVEFSETPEIDFSNKFKKSIISNVEIDEMKDFDEFYTLRQLLHPILPLNIKKDNNCINLYKNQFQLSYDPLYKALDVVPSEGTLDPYECQIISVGINPHQVEQINAQLICEVQGGETNDIPIALFSGNILYSLESTLIDFKIVPVNQICINQFALGNTCRVPFHFLISLENGWFEDFEAEPRWISVNHVGGTIHPSESLNITLSYFPGRVGHFMEMLQLYIAFEDPICLKIKGYAAFPQVYFNLPRPGFNSEYVNLLSYAAISDIVYAEHSQCESFSVPTNIIEFLEVDDWVVVEYKSSYPSAMDIHMSTERSIANEHFLSNPIYIKQFYNQPSQPIPNLVLPPYEINFGYVIVDTVQDIYLNPIRYKPYSAKLDWLKLRKEAHKYGLKLHFRKNIEGPFLIYKPSSQYYKFNKRDEHYVNVPIYAKIPGGATLEFRITAIVTLPQIKFKTDVVDFGEIQCGYCCKKTIFMETNGHVKCAWKANILTPLQKYNSFFFTMVTEDSFTTKNTYELDVYFRPKVHGKCECKLVITIESNPEVIPITLLGVGLVPKIKITESVINFKPTLPYSINNVEKMKITNNSKFPIEFIFTDFNNDLDFENHVVRFLKKYYQTKELLIPLRKVGEEFLPKLVEKYYEVLAKLRICLKKKLKNEMMMLYKKNSKYDMQSKVSLKKIESQHVISLSSLQSDPIKEKTYQEIENYLQDNLISIKPQRSNLVGNLNQVVFDVNIQPTETSLLDVTKKRNGCVMIFHGAPNTGFLLLANKTGRKLGLHIYGIDNLVREAILEKQSLAAIKINEEIDAQIKQQILIDENEDEHDILEKKIILMLTKPNKDSKKPVTPKDKMKKKSTKSSKSTKSNQTDKMKKKSTKSSKSTKSNQTDKSRKTQKSEKKPKLHLSENLLLEILQQKLLSLEEGFVIESLDSIFFPEPHALYMNLLTFLGNISYIHMIFVSFGYHDFIMLKRKEYFEDKQEIKGVVARCNEITEMDADSYETLDKEEMIVFRKNVLVPRKTKMLNREEERRKKHFQKYKQNISKQVSSKKSGSTNADSKTISKSDKTSVNKFKKMSKSSKKSSKAGDEDKDILSPEDFELSKKLQSSEQLLWKLTFISEHWNKKNIQLMKELPSKVPIIKEKKKKEKGGKKEGGSKKDSRPSSKKSSSKKKSSKASSKSSGSKVSKGKSAKSHKTKKSSPQDSPVISKPERKIDIKIMNSEEIKAFDENGVHCWIINSKKSDETIEELVISNLQNSEELSEYLNLLKISSNSEFVENIILYSVLAAEEKKQRADVAEVFRIYDAIESEHTKINNVSSVDETVDEKSIAPDSSKNSVIPKKISTEDLGLQKVLSLRSQRSQKSTDTLKLNRPRKRKSTKDSLLSTQHKIPTNETLVKNKELEPGRSFKGRYIIDPNNKLLFDIFFNPKNCGDYSNTYNLSVVCGLFHFSFLLKGKADIPKINTKPEILFSKILTTQNPKKIENCVYYRDQDLFSLGPIFCEEHDNKNSCFKVEGRFNIFNQSCLPSDVSFSLEERCEHFSANETNILIPPNTSESYSVYAHPSLCGTFYNKLLLGIKNNPKIEKINLACIGVAIDAEVRPAEINFERVLLGETSKRTIFLKNNSLVSLIWRFECEDPESFFNVFVAKIRKGVICPMTSLGINFKFTASDLNDVGKKILHINFYDEASICDTPLVKKKIEFSASVVQFFVEYVEEIYLGEVKLSFDHVHKYDIHNKSKIDVKFRFQHSNAEEDTKADQTIRSYFKIVPPQGIIKSNSSIILNLIFAPQKVKILNDMNIFKCDFFDIGNGNKFHSFNLRVSAKVIGSSFSICPPQEINFAHQLIQTEVTKEIMISNNGIYSFTYAILSYKKDTKKKKGKKGKKDKKGGKKKLGKIITSKKSKDSKKSKSTGSKESKSSKSKKSKSTGSKKSNKTSSKKSIKMKIAKPTTLTQGIFTLTSSTGVIEPKSTAVIKVTCKPKKIDDFDEYVAVFISQTAGKNRKGQIIQLRAKGCVPYVDFENFDDMFKEQFVVENLDEFICPEQVGVHPVFIKENKQLYFNKSCLNIPNTVRIKIRNSGQVGALVTCNMSEGGDVFTISPKSSLVDAGKFVIFLITFQPTAIDKFYGTLEFQVFMNSNKFSLKLCGEGYLPEIQIIKPFKNISGNHILMFSPQLIGAVESKELIIKNTGVISCKILIGVQDDEHDSISLKPKEFPKVLTNMYNEDDLLQEFKHTLMMELNPEEDCTVNVQFKANTEAINNCTIRIFIVNNPYELIDISIKAEGYKREIILDGLETIASDNDEMNGSFSSESFWEAERIKPFYKLDFGYQFLNRLHKKCFKITNVSEVDIYKFVFSDLEKLVFIPAVGHLKPLASKDIIATFFTKEATVYHEVLLELRTCKIEYLEPEIELLSWDERQHFTIWKSPDISIDNVSVVSRGSTIQSDENMGSTKSKTTTERKEPAIKVVKNSHKNLNILFSITANYSEYEIDISEINIEDTLMFETRKANFVIKNTSNVDLPITWSLSMHEEHPKGLTEETNPIESLSKYHNLQRPRTTCPPKRRTYHLTGLEKFYKLPIRPKSALNSDLESNVGSSSSSIHINDAYSDSIAIPFTLNPIETKIPPNETQIFTITFSPHDVYQYQIFAKATIPNLSPNLKQPAIPIKAKSLLPLYHFNIETSDYLSRRGGREVCGETIDESTKILEFEVIGTGIPVTRKFTILNPTGETFSYRWKKSQRDKNLSLFQCEKPSGIVTKGEMAEAVFTFIAEKKGTFEMVYTFLIEKYNLPTKFLLIGKARDPCIFFKQHSIQLKPTIIAMPVSQEILLVNNEAESLKFKFVKASSFSEGRLHRILVEPNKGVINEKHEIPVKLTFNPVNVGEVTFNLECRVENMETNLKLVVNGNCFSVQSVVSYFNNLDRIVLNEDNNTVIAVPSMMMMKEEFLKFTISNIGQVGFYFKWKCLDKYIEEFIKVDFPEKEGYIKIGNTVSAVVSLKATKQLMKKSVNVALKVLYGATYKITFICSTCRTKFKLSFREFNFGPCLVQKEKSLFYEAILEITNNELNPITVDINDEELDFITVIKKTNSILPKKIGKIMFYFHPFEIQQYKADFRITVNNQDQSVQFYGEGVPLEIELRDPKTKITNLGAVYVGKFIRQQVRVTNKSKCPVTIFFGLYDRLPINNTTIDLVKGEFEKLELKPSDIIIKKAKKKGKGKGSKIKKGKKSSKGKTSTKNSKKSSKSTKSSGKSDKSGKSKKSSKSGKSKKSSKSSKKAKNKKKELVAITETQEERQRRLVNSFIKILPDKWSKLQPDQDLDINITFTPKERMPLFTEQIFYQVQDYVNPILMFKTSCIAASYSLDYDRVNFGTVIKGCQNDNLVKLFNQGDIGGKYKWILSKKGDFYISPMSGYITPGMCVVFETKYVPSHLSCLSTTTAHCVIENYSTPLSLELIGTCISLPPPREVIKFSCPVREQQIKHITIKNPSGFEWNILTSLAGNHFIVPDKITVESKSSTTFNVVYSPLVMTSPNKFHEGKLFLPLPEGQGLLFDFIGEAKRPTPVTKIERTIPSKVNHTESLKIINWLPHPQQLTVVNQIDQSNRPKKVPLVLYRLMGNQYINLSPYEEKDYKWIIHPLNEGKLNFKVKFRNEETKEYIENDVNLVVTKCEPLESISMFACARSTYEYRLKLENPLKETAIFKISSPCANLHFEKVVNVKPYTQETLLLEYKPLLPVKEFQTSLEAVTNTMGTFLYTLILSAGPAIPEPVIHFETQLGSKLIKTVNLYNPLDTKIQFDSKIESKDFYLERQVIIERKSNGKVDIAFEPSELGGFQSKLVLNSSILGEYIYPLIGTSNRPKPQGPFVIDDVSNIYFKNPFLSTMTFSFKVEPAAFLLKQSSAIIKARETIPIQITSRIFDNGKFPIVGKLIIKCEDDENANDLEWVMYLRKSVKQTTQV